MVTSSLLIYLYNNIIFVNGIVSSTAVNPFIQQLVRDKITKDIVVHSSKNKMEATTTEEDLVDDEVEQDDDEEPLKCFSLIQSKKFWSHLLTTTCKLCPSMDLVILGMQQQQQQQQQQQTTLPSTDSLLLGGISATSLWLHRTVTWQRLATLTNFNGQDDTEGLGVTHVEWSSDGRNFALALTNGDMTLYQVEAMVSSTSSMSGESTSPGLLCVLSVAREGILGLKWAVERSHPRWNLSVAEQEEALSWRYVVDNYHWVHTATVFFSRWLFFAVIVANI